MNNTRNLFTKLGVSTRQEVVILAKQRALPALGVCTWQRGHRCTVSCVHAAF